MESDKEENYQVVSQVDCEMKTNAAKILAKGKQKAKLPPQPRRRGPGRSKIQANMRLQSEIYYRGGSSLTAAYRDGFDGCARSLSVSTMVTSADADDNARQGDDSPQPGPSGIIRAAGVCLDEDSDHSDSTTSSGTPQHSFLGDPVNDNAMDGVDYDISNDIDTMNSEGAISSARDTYVDGMSRSQALAVGYHDLQGQASGGQAQAIDYTDNQMLLFNEDPDVDDYSYGKAYEESYKDYDYHQAHQIKSMFKNAEFGSDHNGEDIFVPTPDNLNCLGPPEEECYAAHANDSAEATTILIGVLKQKENQISWHVCNNKGTLEKVSFTRPIIKEVSGQLGDNCRHLLSNSPLESSHSFMTGADAASHSSGIEPEPMQSERRHFQQLSEVPPGPTAQDSAQAQPPQDEVPSTRESAEVEARVRARPRRPYRQLYVPPARRASIADPGRSSSHAAHLCKTIGDNKQHGLPPYRKPWPRREPPASPPPIQAEQEWFGAAVMPPPEPSPSLPPPPPPPPPHRRLQKRRATTSVSDVATESMQSVQSVQSVEPVDLSSPRTLGPHSVHAEPFYPSSSHVTGAERGANSPEQSEVVRLQFAIVDSCHDDCLVEGGLPNLKPVSFIFEPVRPDYYQGEPSYQQPQPVAPVYWQPPSVRPVHPQQPIYQPPMPTYPLPLPAYYEPQQQPPDPLYAVGNVQMGTFSDARRFPPPPPAYAQMDLDARVRYHTSRESDYGIQFRPPAPSQVNALWEPSYQRDVREAADAALAFNAPADVPDSPNSPAAPAAPAAPDAPNAPNSPDAHSQRPDAAGYDNLGGQQLGLGRGRNPQPQSGYLPRPSDAQHQRLLQPVAFQPGTWQPGAVRPGVWQPGTWQPVAVRPGAWQFGAGQAGADQALVSVLVQAFNALSTKTRGRGRIHRSHIP